MLKNKFVCFLFSIQQIDSNCNIRIIPKAVIGEFEDNSSKTVCFSVKNDDCSSWDFLSSKDDNEQSRYFLTEAFDNTQLVKKLNVRLQIIELQTNEKLSFEFLCCFNDVDAIEVEEVFEAFQIEFSYIRANLKCRLLFVKPFNINSDIRIDNQKLFTLNKNDPVHVVGHRGLGKEDTIAVYENTIFGFNRCAELNIQFVELDAQFTKDDKVTVFHDFFLDQIEKLPVETEIRKLNYDEIRITLGDRASTGICPLLDSVLENVSENVGIFVEIKFPQTCVGGVRENGSRSTNSKEYYTLKNYCVDTILHIIVNRLTTNHRKIIMLSFDADICLLSKMKQNMFPVLQITRGMLFTDGTPNHDDSRMNSIDGAVMWAKFCGLDGIVVRYNEQLKKHFKRLKSDNLVVFVYGQIPRTKEFFDESKDLGIDGLIVDNVPDYVSCVLEKVST